MANNPIDTNAFTHFLEFVNFAPNELYQITEPIGWDGWQYTLKEEPRRYARNTFFGGVNELEFPNKSGFLLDAPRVVNELGDLSEFMDYGYQWLIYGLKTYGFEFKVRYHCFENGIGFEPLVLDLTDKDVTDFRTYVKAKLIQDNTIQDYKRQFDTKINLFSDKNLKGETITPIETVNYLHIATPKNTISKWVSDGYSRLTFTPLVGQLYFNPMQELSQSEISNTLAFLDQTPQTSDPFDVFGFVKATKTLTNVKIKFKLNYQIQSGGTLTLKILKGFDSGTLDLDHSIPLNDAEGVWITYDFEYTIPIIFTGQTVSIYFQQLAYDIEFEDNFIEISATETSFNKVFKASRWVDMAKQCDKAINNIGVDAPTFESGGEHFNNLVFCRSMISNNTEIFNSSFKNALESFMEVNNDYEIYNDVIQVRNYDEFHANNEIGVFLINPDREGVIGYNDELQINNCKIEWKKFEQDREVSGTSNVIHAKSEWNIKNVMVENKFEKSFEFIRDPFRVQDIIDSEVKTPTTVTSTDTNDDVCIVNVVPLAPSEFNTLFLYVNMRVVDVLTTNAVLEMVNRDSTGEEIYLIWNSMGIGVGSTIQLLTGGVNVGNYTVLALDTNFIRLQPQAGTIPTFSGDGFIIFKYFYSNVQFKTRTNEGFSLVDGVPNGFSNLYYTPKRTLLRFGRNLKAMLQYSRQNITMLDYKFNRNVITRLSSESENVVEVGDIVFDDLPTQLINGLIYNLECVADYNEVVNMLNEYKNNKGFVRMYDLNNEVVRLYIKDFTYTAKFKELKVIGKGKFEVPELIITGTIGNLFVNDAPYNLSGVANWWRFQNDYLQLFDEKSRPISNKYKYNLVILNNVTYSTKEELVAELVLLNE
jgi:hypothetical protein